MATTMEQRGGELRTYVQEQISAASPGDNRAPWYVADALSSECFVYEYVNGSEGLESFAAARQEAQSPEVQFLIECQLAIREICQGLADEAQARLTAAESKFTQPQQAAKVAQLQATADRLAPLVSAFLESLARAEAAAGQAAHVARLRSRLERARARGDMPPRPATAVNWTRWSLRSGG